MTFSGCGGHVVVLAASAPPAPSPSTADWLTAWGTVGTAVFAVAAVVVTIVLAARDRREARLLRIEDQKTTSWSLARSAFASQGSLPRSRKDRSGIARTPSAGYGTSARSLRTCAFANDGRWRSGRCWGGSPSWSVLLKRAGLVEEPSHRSGGRAIPLPCRWLSGRAAA